MHSETMMQLAGSGTYILIDSTTHFLLFISLQHMWIWDLWYMQQRSHRVLH